MQDVNESKGLHPVGRASDKLVALSIDGDMEAGLRRNLEAVAELPCVASVLALPDVHQKDRMEVPSSIAVRTIGSLVPEFTSVAVNDGMGVVTTSLDESDLSNQALGDFLKRVNSHAAAHFLDVNRYSLHGGELIDVLLRGAEAVIGKYHLPEDFLGRMEWNGRIPLDVSDREALAVVPRQLLSTNFSRAEMGLNFGGNHFLEVQVVDGLVDRELAGRWGFHEGQVVVMYHLGPGPFSGTLLHHYSRRSKLREARVPLFLLSKLLFHYVQRIGHGSPARKWALHFRHNGWTPYAIDSEEGVVLRRALAMATNFGYAYRMATVRAILDGLREAIAPTVEGTLFCDVAHNGIYEEPWNGRSSWVARHNSCRLSPGQPSIVAGSYDIPSYLGIGLDGQGGRMNSYDHGAGNIIDGYRSSERLGPGSGAVLRLKLTRGRNGRVVSEREVPGRSSEPIDRLMACLEQHRVTRPVVRLRPVANLKN